MRMLSIRFEALPMDEVKELIRMRAPAEGVSTVVPHPLARPVPPVHEVILARPSGEWDAVRALALRQLDRVVSSEPKVLRGDDPDSIHDFRVASRRLQQILNLLYPRPRPRDIRRLRRKLKRCRRALGEVRNCDVLLERVEKALRRKRAAHQATWMAVNDYLRRRRSAGFQKAVGKLSKVNLAVLYVRLKERLTSVGAAPGPSDRHQSIGFADQPSPELFSERLAAELERVWTGFETQIALSHRDPRAPVLHDARIATKRLRYLMEVLRSFRVPGSADALAWLRKLQQNLGDWHDLEVLEQVMIDMVAQPKFLCEHLELAMNAEKLIVRNRGNKNEFQKKYLHMTLESGEFERNKNWVGYLLGSPSAAFAKP
jgi:CHAD domain-containing protein